MDGWFGARAGVIHKIGAWPNEIFSIHNACGASWPDFRDPITEAWLVAWATLWAWQYAPDKCEEDPGIPDGDSWQITIGDIVVQGESRAEAWILALEKGGES